MCKAAGVSKATVSRVPEQQPSGQRSRQKCGSFCNERVGLSTQYTGTGFGNQYFQLYRPGSSNLEAAIFFGSVLHHANRAAQQAGKKLLVIRSKNSAEGERESVETIANQRCDAILLL